MVHRIQNYITPSPADHEVNKFNNNSEKYSLRQRQRSRHCTQSDNDIVFINNSNSTSSQNEALTKLSAKKSIGQTTKVKAKGAPLSKYRRKTANARERSRMREINTAFENLRQCVPMAMAGDDLGSANEKLTKITTLRLAIKYIQNLSEALTNPYCNMDFFSDSVKSEFACNEEIRKRLNEHLSSKPKKLDSHSKGIAAKNKPTPSTLTRCHKKFNRKIAIRQHTTSKAMPLESKACQSSDFFNGVESLLESDGESLHLSEPCFSPANENCEKFAEMNSDKLLHSRKNSTCKTSFGGYDDDAISRLQSPLELSLCLLESPPESLDYGLNQQPLICSSPLRILDPFNPFNDLLHNELTDHTSLDLFLT